MKLSPKISELIDSFGGEIGATTVGPAAQAV